MADESLREVDIGSLAQSKRNLFSRLQQHFKKSGDGEPRVSTNAHEYRYKGDKVDRTRSFYYYGQSADNGSYDDKWNNIVKLGAYGGLIKGVLFEDGFVAWSGRNDFTPDHEELGLVEKSVKPLVYFSVYHNDAAPHTRITADATSHFDPAGLKRLGDYFDRSIFENRDDVQLTLCTSQQNHPAEYAYKFLGNLDEYSTARHEEEARLTE